MQIPLDKQAHFLGGYALAATFFPVSISFAMFIVVLSSFGKELYDYFYPAQHTADKWDAGATIIGGGVACMLLTLIGYLS